MKTLILSLFLSAIAVNFVNADAFVLGSKYDPVTKTYSQTEQLKWMQETLGTDPRVFREGEADPRLGIMYGHLLGIVKGEQIPGAPQGMTRDKWRIQFMTKDGERIGKPVLANAGTDVQLVLYRKEIDTFWDLERFYGSINRSFETEYGSEIFEMVLMGILDPTGEMGLNTLQVKIDLPDDFIHGWLTHYTFFGKPEFVPKVGWMTDTADAFDDLMLGYGGAKLPLLEQLAIDEQYGSFEPGLRPHVQRIVALMVQFRMIEPSQVRDPELAQRAQRLRSLGEMFFHDVTRSLYTPESMGADEGRPVKHTDRVNAYLRAIDAFPNAFYFLNATGMSSILNAGSPERPGYPHPDCAALAFKIYFNLLKAPTLTDDPDVNRRLLDALAQRRRFAMYGLSSPAAGVSAELHQRTRAAFLSFGYGSSDDVQLLVGQLSTQVPRDYIGNIISKGLVFAPPTPIMPLQIDGANLIDPTEGDQGIAGGGLIFGDMDDETTLNFVLEMMKELAFKLPQDAIGRAHKVAIVENWRQAEIEQIKPLPALNAPLPGEPELPPELTPKQKFYKEQLTTHWKPTGAAEPIVEP